MMESVTTEIDIVDRILDESDLCRSETADDVADLLDEAAREIQSLREVVRGWHAAQEMDQGLPPCECPICRTAQS
jgi:hypothetical protein